MLGRYLKAQMTVLLFGGLVGPIFLIVYFALGPFARPYIGWMFWVGLFDHRRRCTDCTVADGCRHQILGHSPTTDANRRAGAGPYHRDLGHLLVRQQPADDQGEPTFRRPRPGGLRHPGENGVQPDAHADPQRAQAGGARRSRHSEVRDRLERKRIDCRRGSRPVHLRPRRTDLRSARPGRAADADHADPAGQRHPDGRHDRHPLQPGGARAGARHRPPGGGRAGGRSRSGATARPGPMPAPFMAPPPGPTTAQRLQELETLRAIGTITDDEYNKKRQQIYQEL